MRVLLTCTWLTPHFSWIRGGVGAPLSGPVPAWAFTDPEPRTLSPLLSPAMPTFSSQPCTCTNLLKLMRFALERTWLMETVLTGSSPEREREMLEEEQE